MFKSLLQKIPVGLLAILVAAVLGNWLTQIVQRITRFLLGDALADDDLAFLVTFGMLLCSAIPTVWFYSQMRQIPFSWRLVLYVGLAGLLAHGLLLAAILIGGAQETVFTVTALLPGVTTLILQILIVTPVLLMRETKRSVPDQN